MGGSPVDYRTYSPVCISLIFCLRIDFILCVDCAIVSGLNVRLLPVLPVLNVYSGQLVAVQ